MCFSEALEQVLREKGIVDSTMLQTRMRAISEADNHHK
jgi:hypothetical protein